jgi:hypothetical protein
VQDFGVLDVENIANEANCQIKDLGDPKTE